jgi:hypothetical protein
MEEEEDLAISAGNDDSSSSLSEQEGDKEKLEHDLKCYMCLSDKTDTLGPLFPCPECACVVHLACLVRDGDYAGKSFTPKCMLGHDMIHRDAALVLIVSVPTLLQKQVAAGLLPQHEYILMTCAPAIVAFAFVWLVGIFQRRVDAHILLSLLYAWCAHITEKQTHLHHCREIFPMFMLAWAAMLYVPLIAAVCTLTLLYCYGSTDRKARWLTFAMVIGTWMSTEAAPHGPAALFNWTVLWIVIQLALRVHDEFFGKHSLHPVVTLFSTAAGDPKLHDKIIS